MNFAKEARKLANYIESLEDFKIYTAEGQFKYNHIGALLTDIVLQAGMNYNYVVRPRVIRVLLNYPNAYTLDRFRNLISDIGLENIIDWNHSVKLTRMNNLIHFLSVNDINTCVDFKKFLLKIENQNKLKELDGVGLKTVDYLLKLLNFDVVAVDRHIYSFIELAEIYTKEYQVTKKIVEYAADLLHMSRASLDCSIWHFMSDKDYIKAATNQLVLEF